MAYVRIYYHREPKRIAPHVRYIARRPESDGLRGFARAAALPDPSELRVSLRPTPDRTTWHAHVSFNFRNTAERQTQHINPQSLQQTILAQAPSVPALAVQAGAVVAKVTLAIIEAIRQPTRAATEQAVSLDPPAPMRATEAPSRTRA